MTNPWEPFVSIWYYTYLPKPNQIDGAFQECYCMLGMSVKTLASVLGHASSNW